MAFTASEMMNILPERPRKITGKVSDLLPANVISCFFEDMIA